MARWLWFFWLYSFLGWLTELSFAAVSRSPVRQRRCMLLLPLCPVYGLAMTALLALPAPLLRGVPLFFIGGAVTTAVEYLWHWGCEAFLGVRFWDYTGVFGAVQGRVCLPFSLAWGVLTCIALRFVHPLVLALTEAAPPLMTYLLLLLFTADAVCTLCFLARTHDVAALRRWLFGGE